MNSDVLWAWAAGIVDGEGCIGLEKNGHSRTQSYTLGLSIEMTHLSTIQKLRRIFGCGKQYERHRNKRHRKLYQLQLHGKEASDAIRKMLPYLVTKREQANLAIEYSERCQTEPGNNQPVSVEVQNLRQIMYEEMQELNKRGAE